MAPEVVRLVSVPTLVSEDAVTPAANVPPVRVPAAAGAVHVDPSVQSTPLTVVPLLAKSAFVIKPVAVSVPVTVNPAIVPSDVIFPCTAAGSVDEIDGTPTPLVIRTPLLPVARFPSVPALS